MLVVSVARRLGSEGPWLANRVAPLQPSRPQKGALGPLSQQCPYIIADDGASPRSTTSDLEAPRRSALNWVDTIGAVPATERW